MTGEGSFLIKELFNDDGPNFQGHFTDEQNILGTLICGNKGEEFSFVVAEKYPAGSIPFDLYYLNDNKQLTTKSNSPSASIQLALLMPAESSNAVISDSLGKIILRFFSDKLSKDSTPDGVLNSMKMRYFENYLNSNEPFSEGSKDGPSRDWQLLKFMHIIYNDDSIVSFYILSYAFTGGAHGLETQEYGVVDLTSGKLIQLKEIFRDKFEQDLSRILTIKMRQMANLLDSQQLTEIGYFVDEIKPTENFYITGNGIGFFYNHYDIAPYSFGSTELFVSNEELKDILK